jgi:LmbE family N-acetylglucosaminyl deacetylase
MSTQATGWPATLAGLEVWAPGEPPGRALVVTAHPDDETLALAGTVQALLAAGWTLELLCLTAGEASYPALAPAARDRLAVRRREELGRAWAHLGATRPPTVLDLPDSGLAGRTCEVERLVLRAAGSSDLVVSLWPDDPHPDHAQVGAAAVRAAREAGVPALTAPLWARVWSGPQQVPVDASWHRVPLDASARLRRTRALAAHGSQVFGFEGQPALLGDDVLGALDTDDVVVLDPVHARSTA